MKKFLNIFLLTFIIVFITGLYFKNSIFAQNELSQMEIEVKEEPDFIEKNFPLVKIKSPYFINDLSYNKAENFIHHPFYYKFGVNDCYVHADIYPNMQKLEQILKEKNLRAMMFDCFRPHEAQLYMWKLHPNPKFLANPHKKGSLHSKGLALDIGLADATGKKLEFATGVDHFVSASSHNYKCKPEEQIKCDNRALLKSIMEQAGFRSIKHEWWHYQKPGDTSNYPLISICNTEGNTCSVKKEELY
ncbi:M15 family metallopeptidase [bacterium]|nr:M15 family metallopeptidase [bacterium]